MSRRPGPTGFDALNEISKRLGDLADHVKTAFEEGAEAAEGFENDMAGGGRSSQRTFTINTPRGPMTGVAGYSLRMGGLSGDNDSGEEFDAEYKPARDKKTASSPAPAKAEAREPLVDQFVEDDEILITAELPGVTLDDVLIDLSGTTLSLETKGASHFKTDVALEAPVKAESLQTNLNNGILQVRLTRLEGDAS